MNIAVFCASSTPADPVHAEVARTLGRSIARAGHTLVYGGSNLGLMGAVSGAALAERGHVVGVIPTLFSEDIVQSQPVSELIRVGSMAERKTRIMAMSDAFVALTGGIGTIDEVSEVMVANQLKQMHKPIILLNVEGFYDPFLQQVDRLRAMGLMRSDCGLHVVGAVEEVLEVLS